MSSHTPGPWVWAGDPVRGCALNSAHGEVLGYADYEGMWFASYGHPEKDASNARLIAAAPDLLAALKMLLADIEEYQRINSLGGEKKHSQVQARAAISAAEGQ